MVDYRYYQSGDEKDIVRLWNEVLVKDPINQGRFRNLVLLDANFDPEGMRLAYSNGELVGCVYAVRRLLPMIGTDLEPENGWIPFFFVKKDQQGQGVGARLMEDATEFLRKNGRENVLFAAYAPNYIVPGVDEEAYPDGYQFLQQNGFQIQYSPVAMDRSLVDFEIPQEVQEQKELRESEGYTFSFAGDEDLYEAIQFATNKFNPDWGRGIREGVLSGLPLNQVLIARKEGQLVGFCLYGGNEGIPERFGPFGVDPEEQGKKLGKILLYECLQAMRADSLHGAWFLWTGEKSSAGVLYKRAGFEVTRTFHVMKKTL